MEWFNQLTPVFQEDDQEWQEVLSEIDELPPFFWYGGAGIDRKPIVDLFRGTFPSEVQQQLPANIFPILTDYHSEILKALKCIYENDLIYPAENHRYWFDHKLEGIECLQMIPLRLFDAQDLKRIRSEYTRFHHCVTSSVIPDDQWHFVYFVLRLNGRDYRLIYGLIENLTFWKEVVEKYSLRIEAFCALKMGGKSGSWDYTHSPKSGQLFNAIRCSLAHKPKIWIADECSELRKIWREINPHRRGFYGQMHFFKTEWH